MSTNRIVFFATAALVALAGVGVASAFGVHSEKRARPCNLVHPCTTTTTTTTTTAPPGALLFSDEFNRASGQPGPATWWRSNSCGTNPSLYSCWNLSNVYMDGVGRLVLRVRAGTMGKPYHGGRAQTLGNNWPPTRILYSVSAPARVEARIKFAPGAGLWGGFWLTRADSTQNELEFDVQEFRGAFPTQVSCRTHGLVEWEGMVDSGVDLSAGFHTYWVNYYRDHVVFGMDGLTCGQTTIPSAPALIIRLSHDVGTPGSWAGSGGPPPASAIPAYMHVDYVRVTAL
jgi:beta-glucanase (GH16 family)